MITRSIKDILTKSFYLFFTIYLVVAGAAYQTGFWSTFGINSFEYSSSLWVLNTVILPIERLFSIMLYWTITCLLTIQMFKKYHSCFSLNPIYSPRVKKILGLFASPFVCILIYLVLLPIMLTFQSGNTVCGREQNASMFISLIIPAIVLLFYFYNRKNFITVVVVLIPVVALIRGHIDAEFINKGCEYNYIPHDYLPNTIKFYEKTDMRYIGKLDGNIFLTPVKANDEIAIVPEKDFNTFIMHHYIWLKKK